MIPMPAAYDTYACRKDKGLHRAIRRAQDFSRKNEWYLKMDIRKYFDSIDHHIAIKLLNRRIKDADVLLLFQQILETCNTEPGKGVPIGNLISQHLANFYLGIFDHWVKEERRIKGYIRYMDDMLIFGPERQYLKNELNLYRAYLRDILNLELKSPVQINRCRLGIPFLGFRVFPAKIRLSPRSRRRFVAKFRDCEQQWEAGKISTAFLVRHAEPLVAFTRAADAEGFRRSVIKQFGVQS